MNELMARNRRQIEEDRKRETAACKGQWRGDLVETVWEVVEWVAFEGVWLGLILFVLFGAMCALFKMATVCP